MSEIDTSAEAVERLARDLWDPCSTVTSRLAAADALRALVAERDRLRTALRDLMTWFPDRPSPPEWRLPGGKYGADEAVAEARAALGDAP